MSVPVEFAEAIQEALEALRFSIPKPGAFLNARTVQKARIADHGSRGNSRDTVSVNVPGLGRTDLPHGDAAVEKRLTHKRARQESFPLDD